MFGESHDRAMLEQQIELELRDWMNQHLFSVMEVMAFLPSSHQEWEEPHRPVAAC